VFIVCGFVMPRILDHHIGQTALGTWDLAWSAVSYFSLAQLGIGSSVNRFVAAHRGSANLPALCRTVSSVLALQAAAAVVVAGLTAVAVQVVRAGNAPSRAAADELAWAIALLGATLAVQTAFDAFRGVITGCHRWGVHNALNAGSHAVTTAAMIGALAAGGTLRAVAAVTLAGAVVTEVARVVLAHRICTGLAIGWRHVSWQAGREILAFGLKSSTSGVAHLLLVQATNILVAMHIGPAALAVYARPLALVRHIETFVHKLAFVLTPTASSLQCRGSRAELRDLLMVAARCGAYVSLPCVVTLGLLGGPVLRLWMGVAYVNEALAATLAFGHLLPLTQQPALMILMGLNRHGPAALVSLGASIAGLAFTATAIARLGWGVVAAAAGTSAALTASSLFVGWYACRTLAIPPIDYFRRGVVEPIAHTLPFALCLVTIRILWPDHLLLTALGAGAACLTTLVPVYWTRALPSHLRRSLLERLGLPTSARDDFGGRARVAADVQRGLP
jgi:O-antigen/teichoic acid export membrane protein